MQRVGGQLLMLSALPPASASILLRRRGIRSKQQLAAHQGGVHTACLQQLLVRALLRDAAALQEESERGAVQPVRAAAGCRSTCICAACMHAQFVYNTTKRAMPSPEAAPT